MSKKYRVIKRTRDAITGRFLPDGTEKRRPKTTVRETIKVPLQKDGVAIKLQITLILSFSLLGCSTVTKSTFVGAGVGFGTGIVSGAMINPGHRNKAALYTGLSMGLIGGIVGYFSHKELEKRDERVRRKTLFDLEQYEVSMPLGQKDKTQYHNLGGRKEIFIMTDDPQLLKKLQ